MTDTEQIQSLKERYELMRDFLLEELKRERESSIHLALERIDLRRQNAALDRENQDLLAKLESCSPSGLDS